MRRAKFSGSFLRDESRNEGRFLPQGRSATLLGALKIDLDSAKEKCTESRNGKQQKTLAGFKRWREAQSAKPHPTKD